MNLFDWLYTKRCRERFSLCLDCELHNRCRRYRKHRYETRAVYTLTGNESVCSWCDKIYDHKGVDYADLTFCCVTCADEYRYSMD